MKSIQVTFDERLLAQLDRDEEARRDGRSAVLRRAVAAYLKRKRRAAIAEGYRRAYATAGGLGDEFAGWERQGQWPDEQSGPTSGSTSSSRPTSAGRSWC